MSKTRKILFIGNSFSEDASYHLHHAALSAGVETKVVNLYIPGCSLKEHLKNATLDKAVYRYELNGQYDIEKADLAKNLVKLSDVLKESSWDYIITQQASHDSGELASYEPYTSELLNFVRQYAPASQFWLQETWSYEVDSNHDKFYLYDHSQILMYSLLNNAYKTISQQLNLMLIPTGSVIQELREEPLYAYQFGGQSLCRDGYHLTYLAGRYAASLVVLKAVLGINPSQVTYEPESRFDLGNHLSSNERELIHRVVTDYFA